MTCDERKVINRKGKRGIGEELFYLLAVWDHSRIYNFYSRTESRQPRFNPF